MTLLGLRNDPWIPRISICQWTGTADLSVPSVHSPSLIGPSNWNLECVRICLHRPPGLDFLSVNRGWLRSYWFEENWRSRFFAFDEGATRGLVSVDFFWDIVKSDLVNIRFKTDCGFLTLIFENVIIIVFLFFFFLFVCSTYTQYKIISLWQQLMEMDCEWYAVFYIFFPRSTNRFVCTVQLKI